MYLLQAFRVEGVVPALHVLSWEFVLAEHSHSFSVFAVLDRLDHLVKVGFVAFILTQTNSKTQF